MIKQFKQPVSMKVTLEQYNRDLKEPLEKLGYVWDTVNTPELDFEHGRYPLLTTGYQLSSDNPSCTMGGHNQIKGFSIDHYNPKLFLAIAGMTEGENWYTGEWLYFTHHDRFFIVNELDGGSCDNNRASNSRYNHSLYRKATLEELINHFELSEIFKPDFFATKTVPHNSKQGETMKTKTIYHTFKLGKREITLCVVGEQQISSLYEVSIGYSVKVPEDTFNEDLGKKIALGRAKSKASLSSGVIGGQLIANDIFKGIAQTWERRITNSPSKYIKGIKVEKEVNEDDLKPQFQD